MFLEELRPGEVAEVRERHVVSKIYSIPRVTALLFSGVSVPGFAMDITTCDNIGAPWNFYLPEQRAKARLQLQQQKPTVLIGSPMCIAFCQLQQINYKQIWILREFAHSWPRRAFILYCVASCTPIKSIRAVFY